MLLLYCFSMASTSGIGARGRRDRAGRARLAEQRGLIWFIWLGLVCWLNQTNRINQRDQKRGLL